jgi:prevent-host-death family protein
MKVSSSEFIRHVGEYQDRAQIEPVVVMKRNREHTVLLSAEEYRRLRRRARVVQRVEEMSDDEIEAISRSEVPGGHEALDDEVG